MDIKFIDELGSGSYGTTYVVEINKKYYAYKIERVLSLDAYYKQIEFNEFAKHYDNFLKLKSYGVIEDCEHLQKLPKHLQNNKEFEKKNKSSKCTFLIYYPVLEYTFKSLENEIYASRSKYLNMFKQVLEGINILRKNGYSHGDIGRGNIMLKGKKWYIIDYGEVSKTFEKNDLLIFLGYVGIYNPLPDYLEDNGKKMPTDSTLIKRIKLYPDFYKLKKWLPKKYDEICLKFLIIILDYDYYKKCINSSDKVMYKQLYPELLLYCIKHCNDVNYDKILNELKKYAKYYNKFYNLTRAQ